MKKGKAILFIIAILLISTFIFITGCNIFGEECPEVNPNSKHIFWTINLNAGLFGQTYCELGTDDPYEGQYVNVFMEYDSHSNSIAQKVAEEFDLMYPTMSAKFGNPVLSQNNSFNGQPRKVTLLLFDIKDGYDGVINTSYVGGYFYSVDYLTQESLESEGYSDKTNEQAIMYIDIYPQDVTKDDVYSTVAHEFQHMINFSEKVLDGGSTNLNLDILLDDNVPTWIDEGFAMAAEQIWANEVKGYSNPQNEWPVYDRIKYFNNSSYFVEGNPLIKWIRSESGYDVLSNYSTSFLFFQYLRVHHPNDSNIFKTMMDETADDINMINPIIQGISFATNFDELLKSWIMANVVNSSSGELGYNNDPALKDVSAVIGSDEKIWGFYPGSFIYRKTSSNPSLPSGIDYIRFGNGGISSQGEYIAILNPNTNPNGSSIEVNVPSGGIVKSNSIANEIKGPQKIDWLIKRPLSKIGIESLKLPVNNK
jgi:hypothetical protein